MITHIVLLQPRPDLTEEQRNRALEALSHAAANVPDIRSCRLGRRVKHGLPGYEQLMPHNFEFALIIEVEDIEALQRYLKAPAHLALGDLFYSATTAALAYDYQFEDFGSSITGP
jgi:hypothetical protein